MHGSFIINQPYWNRSATCSVQCANLPLGKRISVSDWNTRQIEDSLPWLWIIKSIEMYRNHEYWTCKLSWLFGEIDFHFNFIKTIFVDHQILTHFEINFEKKKLFNNAFQLHINLDALWLSCLTHTGWGIPTALV